MTGPRFSRVTVAQMEADALCARQETCPHEATWRWRCVRCGVDLWPRERQRLLREYGVTPAQVSAAN